MPSCKTNPLDSLSWEQRFWECFHALVVMEGKYEQAISQPSINNEELKIQVFNEMLERHRIATSNFYNRKKNGHLLE